MGKKKISKAAIVLLIILALIVVFFTPYVLEFTDETSSYGEAVTITIPKGSTGEEIGSILKENGLIKSSIVFQLKAKLSEDGKNMNYGTFVIYKGMCIPDIIKTLAGNFAYKETARLTVPEGYSAEQIGARCEELGLCTKAEFLQALNDSYDYEFLKNVSYPDGVKYPLQGFLYPETYDFFLDCTPHDIIDRMLKQFEKEITAVDIDNADLYNVITTASLLEREALLESEMPTIAGVITNRLKKGMRLQIDATVQYAVSDGMYNINRVTYADLEIDSPYNTYKVNSLPIGPICNPSIDAIKAALNPESHNYLYYHTNTEKNDGSHIFTENYDDHLATMK